LQIPMMMKYKLNYGDIMKRFFLLLMGILCFSTASHALPINIIAESNHVWGRFMEGGSGIPFDDISTGPLYGFASYSEPREYSEIEAEARRFYTSTYAGGGLGPWVEAENKTLFSVQESGYLYLDMRLATPTEVPFEGESIVSLINWTTNETLLYHRSGGAWPGSGPLGGYEYTSALNLDSSNVYELYLYSRASSAEDAWSASTSVSFRNLSTPVPEPDTMLLFSTGLVGLAGSRLRRKKK
jgi:PEP-CTERM motif